MIKIMQHAIKCFGCCLLLFSMACSAYDENPLLGTVILKSNGEALLPVRISRNDEQPWRLHFWSEDVKLGKSAKTDKVQIYIRNDDAERLTIYLGNGRGTLTIAPSATEKIFDGSLDEMLMLGRTETEELTIKSSKLRSVKATLKFVYKLKYKKLHVDVSTWFLHYGL